MAQYVYTMNRVSKVVPGGRKILENISLSFFPGAKIGVLGLNGSGKSTLLRIMAGIDTQIDGEARPQKGIKVGFLPQEPQLDPSKDVRGNVEAGVAEIKSLLTEFDEISAKFAEPMSDDEMNTLLERQGDLQTKIDAANGWDLDRTLDIAADALRLPPWDAAVANLSGGEKRRVALCTLLLSRPDMLLLDEPTNHLDAESVAWLERFLGEYPGTVVAVTHDRYFLDNVAGWILELDRGRGIPFEGNYSGWLEAKDKRLSSEASQEQARQRAIKTELEWVRSNPKGRQVKSKARLARFEELMSKEVQQRNETAELYIPPGPRLGEKVIELNHVSKGYGDRLLIDELSCSVPRGAIVGIIGANGAGKTTLFRMITGRETPDSGTLELGETVQLAYVDQSRDDLDAKKNVWEEVSNGQDIMRIGSVRNSVARVCRPLQLPRRRSAEESRRSVRRRTQPAASGEVAQARRQRAAARRADQRSRRRDVARARRRAVELPRHDPRDFTRPLVSRPHRNAHAGVRRRQPRRMVRRKFQRLRRRPQEADGRRRGGTHPDSLQKACVSGNAERVRVPFRCEKHSDPVHPSSLIRQPMMNAMTSRSS